MVDPPPGPTHRSGGGRGGGVKLGTKFYDLSFIAFKFFASPIMCKSTGSARTHIAYFLSSVAENGYFWFCCVVCPGLFCLGLVC